mmetsp:Transcript_4418/g.11296  ORF Transcript_4418/g.11296 Transcript_4418/m.11296 type:complete len:331 (-) Transcript_4418:103-1095(-)
MSSRDRGGQAEAAETPRRSSRKRSLDDHTTSSSSRKRQDPGNEANGAEDNFDFDGEEREVANIAELARSLMPACDVGEVKSGLSAEAANTIVGDVMRYILFMNMTKQKVTTEKIRSMAMTIPNMKIAKKECDLLLGIAMQRFKELFDYDMVSTSHAPVLVTDGESAGNKKFVPMPGSDLEVQVHKPTPKDHWILLNLAPEEEEKKKTWKTRPDNRERALTLVILGSIMLNGGIMAEKRLETLMSEELGIPEHSTDNWHVGSLLKELIQEGYLEKRKMAQMTSNQEQIFEFTYGPKAILEIGLPNLLRYVQGLGNFTFQDKQIARFMGVSE